MPRKKTDARALALSVALLFAGTAFLMQPAMADSYNNVQVFASSDFTHPNGFQFAAYNLSGNLIASYQTSYPAAAFELPSGGYLFTVSATQSQTFSNYPCPIEGSGSGSAGSSGPGMPSNGSGSAVIMPVCYMPSSEYGYATATISGSQTINIQMQNVTKLPTSDVTVKVSYVNGTAAAGASVYASVVGEYYWWWQGASISMSSQTDSNGVAHLVLPAAPEVVTAWEWVPILSGKNGSTIQTTVGGEKVNVTVYWEPTYVGLSSSGLIMPPQSSISLTLHYQQPDYWVMPMGVSSKGAYAGMSNGATVASQPNGTPSIASSSGAQGSSQAYLPPQIPAIQQSANPAGSTGGQSGILGVDSLLAATVAIVGVCAAAVLLRIRGLKRRSSTSAG